MTISKPKNPKRSTTAPRGRPVSPSTAQGKEPKVLTTAQWTVADAKARLSEVIEKALGAGPQTITRNGKRAAVVVGIEEWERKTRRKGTLSEFFMTSPLRGSEINIDRDADEPRDIGL